MVEHDESTRPDDDGAHWMPGRGARGWRRPAPARGPSARAYLLIALGEYMLDCEDSCAWTQTIIDALALLGFEQRATRQAIARA